MLGRSNLEIVRLGDVCLIRELGNLGVKVLQTASQRGFRGGQGELPCHVLPRILRLLVQRGNIPGHTGIAHEATQRHPRWVYSLYAVAVRNRELLLVTIFLDSVIWITGLDDLTMSLEAGHVLHRVTPGILC